MPTIFGNTIILGKITIKADAYDEDGIDRVEFYIDNVLKYTGEGEPYKLLWDEFAIGTHEILVKAYDGTGNEASTRVTVFIFNM